MINGILDQVAKSEEQRRRFVRGARDKGPGSGLGLSIVELVLSQVGGVLDLHNLSLSGFEAAILIRPELTRRRDLADRSGT